MNQRQTTQEIATTRPNTARQMEKAGQVAEITYARNGGFFVKQERADGTFTKPQRVA